MNPDEYQVLKRRQNLLTMQSRYVTEQATRALIADRIDEIERAMLKMSRSVRESEMSTKGRSQPYHPPLSEDRMTAETITEMLQSGMSTAEFMQRTSKLAATAPKPYIGPDDCDPEDDYCDEVQLTGDSRTVAVHRYTTRATRSYAGMPRVKRERILKDPNTKIARNGDLYFDDERMQRTKRGIEIDPWPATVADWMAAEEQAMQEAERERAAMEQRLAEQRLAHAQEQQRAREAREHMEAQRRLEETVRRNMGGRSIADLDTTWHAFWVIAAIAVALLLVYSVTGSTQVVLMFFGSMGALGRLMLSLFEVEFT